MAFALLYENSLDPLGANAIFQERERDDFLIKFSLLYFSVYFSGQELDSMVYHDNYNGKFLLAQILPQEFLEKSIFRKNIQTCPGLLPRRNDESLTEVLAEVASPRDSC